MEHLTEAVRSALRQSNWHAALGLALTLPDICGSLEGKRQGRSRYKEWYREYVQPRYTWQVGADRSTHVFLSAGDCYALRCAVLHEGVDTLEDHKAREALESFTFISPPPGGGMIHMNQADSRLQLQVDIFCEDVCAGVDAWLARIRRDDSDSWTRVQRLMKVQTAGPGWSF